ncbi:MYXO-CTERM sorting domain-containing protein [Bradyrhizobium frederickii]
MTSTKSPRDRSWGLLGLGLLGQRVTRRRRRR